MRRSQNLSALLALSAWACNVVPATQVLVEFRATDVPPGIATQMTITIYDEAGDPVEPPETRDVGSAAGQVSFPTTVPVEPLGGDASRRFRIVGLLRDADGDTVARGETTEGFVEGERREVSVELDPNCIPPVPELPALPDGPRYYVGPFGSDGATGDAPAAAWATFAHALSMIGPGDTLILLDGRYTEKLEVRRSGEPGAPITIAADTDGGATIEGGTTTPCQIGGPEPDTEPVSHVELRGLVCIDGPAGGYGAVHISNANNVTLRRVSAHNDGVNGVVYLSGVDHVLLEDVVASGDTGNLFNVSDATDSTLRRCFARWTGSTSPGYRNGVTLFGGVHRVLVENCIATATSAPPLMTGFVVSLNAWQPASNDNRFIGNIADELGSAGFIVGSVTTTMAGTRIEQSVSLRNFLALFQRGDTALLVDGNTWIGRPVADPMMMEDDGNAIQPNSVDGVMKVRDPDFELNAEIRNTVLGQLEAGLRTSSSTEVPTSFEHGFNDFFRVTTPYGSGVMPGEGELMIDPGYDTDRYGDGAYLMGAPALRGRGAGGADIGATILYRLENGVPTDVPLWPWPMESRIERELGGFSPTFEARGGLFRTLCDVY